jgi:hypothetical protein
MMKCRNCDEMIDFVMLKSGRRMPVESADPEEYRVWTDRPTPNSGETVTSLRLVVDGVVLTVWQKVRHVNGRVMVVDGPTHILGVGSHFASCPAADERQT